MLFGSLFLVKTGGVENLRVGLKVSYVQLGLLVQYWNPLPTSLHNTDQHNTTHHSLSTIITKKTLVSCLGLTL